MIKKMKFLLLILSIRTGDVEEIDILDGVPDQDDVFSYDMVTA